MGSILHNSNSMRYISLILILFYAGFLLGAKAKDPDLAPKVYAETSKSVLMIVVRSEKGEIVRQGTGFVVAGGKVVTNEHIVRNGNVLIDLGAVKLPASVERIDTFNDIALLSVGAELSLKPLTIGDVLPKPGTSVYVISNPVGLEKSISTGVVSGIRDFDGRQLLQITAPISPGSSGGPILNARGEVVGVAVGMLEKGQNLNFAVPAALISKLLAGEVQQATADTHSLLNKLDSLKKRRWQYEFSLEPDSNWQKLERQIDSLLESALASAGSDPDLLLKIAEEAEGQNFDISITAANHAVLAKPTAEGYLILGRGLTIKAILAGDAEKTALQERAEKALRNALQLSKQPSAKIHYHLAELLENRDIYIEAESNFRRALDLSKKSGDSDLQVNSLRGLVRTAYLQGKGEDGDNWFKALIDSGKINAWDWEQHGHRLDGVRKYREAAQSFQQAALHGGGWNNWCEASSSYYFAGGQDDAVLFTSRKCISEGSGKKYSENHLAPAHKRIAEVLNERGVYQGALSHAREAAAINPSDPFAFNAQAEALLGLLRFQEAINASTQAIRLSDGKYSSMHFNLGLAYFKVENWILAKNSFEKAAQLNPKDDAAAYNVAISCIRLGYYRNAANWYEECLSRNPSRRDRQDILDRIKNLRR